MICVMPKGKTGKQKRTEDVDKYDIVNICAIILDQLCTCKNYAFFSPFIL